MATADVRASRTFWNAFVRLLLTCAAALGFSTPARGGSAAAIRTDAAAGTTGTTGAAGAAEAAETLRSPAAADGARADETPGVRVRTRTRTRARTGTVPAPRTAAAPPHSSVCPPRRDRRNRTLPPTMKQRITAEAHGATPAARSVLTAEAGAAHLLAPVAPAALSGTRTALIPAPRARAAHEALCD